MDYEQTRRDQFKANHEELKDILQKQAKRRIPGVPWAATIFFWTVFVAGEIAVIIFIVWGWTWIYQQLR